MIGLFGRGQEAVQGLARIAGARVPPGRRAIAQERGIRIEIVLGELQRDGHVEHVPHGGVAIRRALGLWDIARDRSVGIEQAVAREHAGKQRRQRFRHREDDVRLRLRLGIAIPLVHDLAAPEHDERIARGGIEILRKVHAFAARAPHFEPRQIAERSRERCDAG